NFLLQMWRQQSQQSANASNPPIWKKFTFSRTVEAISRLKFRYRKTCDINKPYLLQNQKQGHKAYITPEPEKTDTTRKCHFMIVKRVQNVVKNKKKRQCKNCDINEEYINTVSESQNVKLIYTEKARLEKEQHMKLYSNCVYCPRHHTKTELRKKFTSEDSTEKMSLRFFFNILEKVGEGAYAEVHKAEWKDSSTVRTVALKFMKSVKSPEILYE
ncbi:2887_t:CDS:2, partial [Gigaspora rosea]